MPKGSSDARVRSAAMVRIQRLCCLGLGGRVIMPELLRELHALVPSVANDFLWADGDGELTEVYCESPETTRLALEHLPLLQVSRTQQVMATFPEAMRRRNEPVVHDFFARYVKVDWRDFQKSDLYNGYFRPLRYHQRLKITVAEGDRKFGALMLNRGPGEPPFTRAETMSLAALAPHIAHAQTAFDADRNGELVESDDRGLMIADRRGDIVQISVGTSQLLFMAEHAAWPALKTEMCRRGPRLPEGIRRGCERLGRLLDGAVADDATAVMPLLWRRHNEWGEFVMRGFPLQAAGTAAPDGLIGITIERLEPLPLGLLRRMDRLPLSDREKELCLLLADGHNRAEVARRMRIAEQTVLAHVRNVFTKLDVHSRAELVYKIRSS